MIYRALYMDKIMPFIDTPFVKILTGVRRSGKSTLLKMLQEELVKCGVERERICAYRFDSDEYEELNASSKLLQEAKSKLVAGKKTYFFFDEIQEVKNWEKCVNTLLSDYDVDIYVTGSNSRMLSSEISTYLTGRYVSFRVYPLSFKEYLDFRSTYKEITDIYSEFKRYLLTGGFPALQLHEYERDWVYTVVKDIYNSTIFTDIVKRNQIRKLDQLERIVKYTFDNVGNTFSALTLAKYLKSQGPSMDVETVYNYLSHLEKAFIVHRCSRYDIKGKEILKTQEKFYLADTAFRFAVLGYRDDMVASSLENIIYLELLRRGYDVYVGKIESREVDFIAVRKDEKLYVQLAQSLTNAATRQREYGNLLAIADNYPKYVLSMDTMAGGNYEGIKSMHVADFLLSERLS